MKRVVGNLIGPKVRSVNTQSNQHKKLEYKLQIMHLLWFNKKKKKEKNQASITCESILYTKFTKSFFTMI
ncbi:hypothetical protein Hanom_Chr16g01517331 [Helianthus anomalus]